MWRLVFALLALLQLVAASAVEEDWQLHAPGARVEMAPFATTIATVAVNFWSSSQPATSFPARTGHSVARDPGSGRLLVIGGTSAATALSLNDVWASVDSGNSWSCSSCATGAVLFTPRFGHAVVSPSTGVIALTGGTRLNETTLDTTGLNDLWLSYSSGVQWQQVTASAPWSPQSGVQLYSDSLANLWCITDIGPGFTQPLIWQVTAADSYANWTAFGSVDIGGLSRYGFGITITSEDLLYLVGGSGLDSDGAAVEYNDVWLSDLYLSPQGLHWTRLAAAATWTPRRPSLNVDSLGNLFLLGRGAETADILWLSPRATRGTTWERVDNTSCTTVWPYPLMPTASNITTFVDSSDRLLIVGGGSNETNPTNTLATAFVQLSFTSATDTTNRAASKVLWTTCQRSSSSSTGTTFQSSTGTTDSSLPNGGVIGKGGSSFGSTDAVFLTTVVDVWIDIILWTMVFTSFAFVGAALLALRVNRGVKRMWLWLPPAMMMMGATVGFMHGCVSAALIGAIAIAIPYPVGIDIAAGLGIGQAICIVYFHLGRADFIHR